jgi:glyoxalase family protein
MPTAVPGIHHVTAITADVQRNVDFYVGTLGLRFIKKTVNFDVPDTYHLYFADYVGTPGTAMTFFGWPHLPWGPPGAGQVVTVAFAIPPPSLEFWERRLRQHAVEARRETRFGIDLVALKDPDGIRLELVGEAKDDRWQAWAESPVDESHQIRGFHSVGLCVTAEAPSRTFLTDVMRFKEVAREGSTIRFATGEGGPHSMLELLVRPDARRGEETTGTVHHVAWRTPADEEEVAWRQLLVESGREVTPVIDRKYFHSIYFREPGGVLFEIATDRPGFTVDEPANALGSALQLPPQYEDRRENLNFNLPPMHVPTFAGTRSGS